MKFDYQIYNNAELVASLLYSVLRRRRRINIAISAAILPLVLDESVCNLVENRHFSLMNILQIGKNKLLNFNEQYYDALPVLVDGVSVLLDFKLILLTDVNLVFADNACQMQDCNESMRLEKIVRVFSLLYHDAENMKLSNLYRQLNIEL